MASGSLTRRETRTAIRGQRHVNRMERRAGSDGIVTTRERVRLEHAQDRQSGRIYGLKHNNRTRD